MNLSGFRDAIATYFTYTYSELNVSKHGGEFTLESVLKYAKADPALVIAITRASTDKSQRDGSMFNVRVSAVVMARARAGEPQDARALRIASYIMGDVTRFPSHVWGLSSTVDIQAPRNIDGVNLFSAKVDVHAIALFGISWEQQIDITPDTAESYEDFETFHGDYDLGPDPDDEIEAEDTVIL
jgi:hypothetical protein